MKLCVAQTRPIKGDIERNIQNHIRLIDLAVSNGAEIIIFPELSLIGYEPTLSKALATTQYDSRLSIFQNISDAKQITIGVGVPTKNNAGICISLVIFQPNVALQLYSKKYLHADEEPYFVSGQTNTALLGNKNNIGVAICYELSVYEHSDNAAKNGASIYMASVAKSANGVKKANQSLSEIAQKYGMTVLMSNCVGQNDDFISAGNSAVWNNKGDLVAQLNDSDAGILIYDSVTENVIAITI